MVREKTVCFTGHRPQGLPWGDNKTDPRCQAVMLQADLVHVVGQSRDRRQAFFERNRYMVDHSDMLIAGKDAGGQWAGGTGMTYRHALGQGLEIITVPYG